MTPRTHTIRTQTCTQMNEVFFKSQANHYFTHTHKVTTATRTHTIRTQTCANVHRNMNTNEWFKAHLNRYFTHTGSQLRRTRPRRRRVSDCADLLRFTERMCEVQ